MSDFFDLYNEIIRGIDPNAIAESAFFGERWAMARCAQQTGIAMSTHTDSIAPALDAPPESIKLSVAAQGIKSWNFKEASIVSAACNAYYNTPERLCSLNAYEPYENYCTAGLDMSGANIALIGHLTITEEMRSAAANIYILERSPQPGDYPDSACDFIIPRCDIVIITGSAIINKTLPHLLELSRNAITILAGPSVPMCPGLLDHGIDRLAGMVVNDCKGMEAHVLSGQAGNPYAYGTSFLLKK